MTPPAANFRQVAMDTVSQPDLFAAVCAIHPEHEIVQAARQRRYNGSRVPEAKAREIVALRLSGESLRGIERRTGADHRTVRAVVAAAEEQGLVPAIKERMQREMLELAEATAELLRGEMNKDEPDAQIIKAGWVGLGIAADKAAALQVAGDLHLHQHVHVGGPSADDPAAAYAAMLKGAVDVESEVVRRKQLDLNAMDVLDTSTDTDGAPLDAVAGPAGSTADRPTDPTSGPDPRRAEGEGGGVANCAPGSATHGKP